MRQSLPYFTQLVVSKTLTTDSPDKTMRIFSSAENCRRVMRRICLMTCSAGSFSGPDFCPLFCSLHGYDGPEILPSSTHPICLTAADAGHTGDEGSACVYASMLCGSRPAGSAYVQTLR